MIENNLINQVLGVKERALTPYNGLDVTWFDAWHPALDEALQSLPEMETCPHELFRLLTQNPGSAPKKTALVTKHGTPVAIIPLRAQGRRTYEVPARMILGGVFPTKPEFLILALEALRSAVWVSWQRMQSPPPPSRLIRYQKATPVHVIRFSEDYERYWRESGHFKNLRNKRNRCKDFNLAVNSPGSAEWTIKNSVDRWRDHTESTARGSVDWIASDWTVFAEYWERQGRHFTLLMLDHGTPIAGSTLMVHHNDAVGGLIYRDPEYESYGIGTRLLDLTVSFAAESGYDTLDMGATYKYKSDWAPQSGEIWHFQLCPEPLFWATQAKNWTRTASANLVNWFRKGRAGRLDGSEG